MKGERVNQGQMVFVWIITLVFKVDGAGFCMDHYNSV